mmetsp:Transcript_8820/g.14676  ORF Transcript_8820/g.14676 Transcript_8820/m.14676 type:complete len:291 (+) Transcript_8820:70-942(+)|eukprot:CAMPEP_0174971830 /NCGR_PEP_ID=MMETSP0004_2-20121128/10253_1 /TAXON_ID=420556 /ORGANISM="Ochromonas sp., Strain CCMP1393" /LENGTH=290 /DNA_ID=CAMNT_0016221909 /DNA_START=60 /DNA_END=932 /DNA_ORIENTATION=+
MSGYYGSDQQKVDEATLQQMDNIQSNVVESQPLISEATSVAVLAETYIGGDSSGFLPGISYLNDKYTKLRRVRGDGNCFYRSFLFAYLENLIIQLNMPNGESSTGAAAAAKHEYDRIHRFVVDSKQQLVAIGYDEFALETFHDVFTEFIVNIPSMTTDSLFDHFVNGGEADYYTWYMRLLTAGFLRLHEDRFFPFLMDGVDIDMASYCRREVEPMGKDSDQLHIIALTEYLNIPVSIEYLDGRDFNPVEGLSCIQFPQRDSVEPVDTAAVGCPFVVTLLYRPGHYDILYP